MWGKGGSQAEGKASAKALGGNALERPAQSKSGTSGRASLRGEECDFIPSVWVTLRVLGCISVI